MLSWSKLLISQDEVMISSLDSETVPFKCGWIKWLVVGAQLSYTLLELSSICIRRQHSAGLATLLNIGVHFWCFTHRLVCLNLHALSRWTRQVTLAIQEAHLEIRRCELLYNRLIVSFLATLVALKAWAVFSSLCRDSFVVCHTVYSHISGLVGGGVCVSAEDIAAVGHIRLLLDRSFMLVWTRTKARILVEHAFLVLSNLYLMVSDFIPVDLTCTKIHWRFVETFLMLFLSRDHSAQYLRNIFVTIVVLYLKWFLKAWCTCDRSAISFHWANFSKTDVAF